MYTHEHISNFIPYYRLSKLVWHQFRSKRYWKYFDGWRCDFAYLGLS